MIKQTLARLLHLSRPTWAERYFIVILILGAVLAMLISLSIGLAQSVWFDEAYSIMLAKQQAGELLRLTGLDTHPPLYYLLLKAWAGLFGWSEVALRSLSVLAMGGAVIFAGLLVKRLFGVRAALITLPFVVLAPFLLRYGFEIRMYSLASLIGVAATYVLVSALSAKGRKQWVLYSIYAVLVALGVYTLYYLALLWVAHVVWLLWLWRREKRPLAKAPWLLALAGSVVLFLPWLPTFISQVGNGALAPISQAMTLENILGIISFGFVYQPVWQLTAAVSLLVLFVIITASYVVVRAFKAADKKQLPHLMLLAMYILVPVAVITIVSLARPMYVERYLAHVLIGGMLLVGVSAAFVLPKATRTIKAAILMLPVIMLVGVAHLVQVGNYNFQRLQKPMVDQVAMELSKCKEGATILAADPYVAIELAYYVPTCQIKFYSQWEELKGGYAALSKSGQMVLDTTKLSAERPILYVYYDEPQLQMPEGTQLNSMSTHGKMTVATFSAE